MQFIETFHFHFNQFVSGNFARFSNGLADAAAGGDMVFFNQEGVIETDAMVLAATDGSGIFLCQAQAGQGFARVEYFNLTI